MILWAAAILFLLGFILFAPISFAVSFSLPDAKNVFVGLWGGSLKIRVEGDQTVFGLLGLRFTSGSSPPAAQSPKPAKKDAKPGHPKKRKRILPAVRILLDQKALLKSWVAAIGGCLKRLVRIIRFNTFQADLRIGLPDPAQVGCVMGVWNAIDHVRMGWPSFARIELLPDFQNRKVSGTVGISGQTSLYRVFLPLLVLVFRAPLWRSFFLYRRLRAAVAAA